MSSRFTPFISGMTMVPPISTVPSPSATGLPAFRMTSSLGLSIYDSAATSGPRADSVSSPVAGFSRRSRITKRVPAPSISPPSGGITLPASTVTASRWS